MITTVERTQNNRYTNSTGEITRSNTVGELSSSVLGVTPANKLLKDVLERQENHEGNNHGYRDGDAPGHHDSAQYS